jgi:hypothetical protein
LSVKTVPAYLEGAKYNEAAFFPMTYKAGSVEYGAVLLMFDKSPYSDDETEDIFANT